MQRQELIDRLVSEFDYKDYEAPLIADNLLASSPVVQAVFEKWWRGGELDKRLEVQGYTLQRLMDEYALKPIGALLTMDWLIREPGKALAALAEGYDIIEP